MIVEISRTAQGIAKPATPEELAKDQTRFLLAADSGSLLVTDSGIRLITNTPEYGYTNPNLHRRIETDPDIPAGSNYPFVVYDKNGVPFKQSVVIGVWDGINSYRTTTTYEHDEESTTCEIP